LPDSKTDFILPTRDKKVKCFLISGDVRYLVSGKRNGVRYQILSAKKK
jgi:hypothetical protein